jgi:hypothetical protein
LLVTGFIARLQFGKVENSSENVFKGLNVVGSFKQGGVEGEDRRSLPLKAGFSFLFFENIILLEKGTMTFFRQTLVILNM